MSLGVRKGTGLKPACLQISCFLCQDTVHSGEHKNHAQAAQTRLGNGTHWHRLVGTIIYGTGWGRTKQRQFTSHTGKPEHQNGLRVGPGSVAAHTSTDEGLDMGLAVLDYAVTPTNLSWN